MRRAGVLFLLCAVLLFAGCGQQKKAWFLVFAAPFEAEIDGTLREMAFSAKVVREGETLTLTFYAPATLSGTVLCRDGAGQVTARVGDVAVETGGYDDLFLLFPTVDNSKKAAVTEAGTTRLDGDGFFAEFLPDGTPLRLGRGGATVTVVRFAPLEKAG